MQARKIRCRILGIRWFTPTVLRIRFEATPRFSFDGGQFLSVIVPPLRIGKNSRAKRLYSLASPPEEAKLHGVYELCVKYVRGGAASEYLAGLKPGDVLEGYAPYGHFLYRAPKPGRNVCFISTGTGIAPVRSIVLSRHFQEHRPVNALVLSGVRTEEDRLYSGDFAPAGAHLVEAVSQPGPGWGGYRGRVTDYLRQLPATWAWHTTDFYMCGNDAMINEVVHLLHGARGVSEAAIYKEAFSTGPRRRENEEFLLPFPDRRRRKAG